MEIKGVKELLTGQSKDLKMEQGIFWVFAADGESVEEIYKLISMMNEKDIECEFYELFWKRRTKLKIGFLHRG